MQNDVSLTESLLFAAFSFDPDHIARLLVWMRFIGAALTAVALSMLGWLGNTPPTALWLLPVAIATVNCGLSRRIAKTPHLGSAELCLHIAGDSLALFVLLWPTGGAANPFVSFFLVPVALASVALPMRYAAAITGLCIAGYTTLLLRYLYAVPTHAGVIEFERHTIGMWGNFVLAAALLCFFLLALTEMLRKRERELAAQRERLLRDDAIMSVATLAAGAAHSLNTPLGTIVLAAESLAEHPELPADAREEVATIADQVAHCERQLRRLVEAHRSAGMARVLPEYAAEVMARWRARRPEIESRQVGINSLPPLRLRDDPALSQAFINLLDNAAEASMAADSARIAVHWACENARRNDQDATLALTIDDDGQNVDHAALNRSLTATTKPQGLGLGLTLARASIARLGGRLTLTPSPAGGTRTRVCLPLAALADEI